jgi:hypothetical protein
LDIDKSDCLFIVVVTVEDVLLPGVGSVNPVGTETLAVLLKLPVVLPFTVPPMVRVTLCPPDIVTPVQSPVPDVYVPAPGVYVVAVNPEGRISVTVK